MSVFIILRKLGCIMPHIADVGTDIFTAVQYIALGELWWGGLVIFFILLSMAITAIIMYIGAIKDWKWKPRGALVFIVCFPLVPLWSLFWDLHVTLKEYRHSDSSRNNTTNTNNIGIKTNNNSNGVINNENRRVKVSEAHMENIPMIIITTSDHLPADVAADQERKDIETLTTTLPGYSRSDSYNSTVHVAAITMTRCKEGLETIPKFSKATSDNVPIHVAISAIAKLSEALTEAFPQACIGMHVIFQTLFAPGAEGTIETFQWISLVVSILTLALSMVIIDFVDDWSMSARAKLFIFLVPAITIRLIICSTLAMIQSAMFIVPLGTEFIVLVCILSINKGCCSKILGWNTLIGGFSTIYIWFSFIGLCIDNVPKNITIPTMVLTLFMAPIQEWLLKE